MAQNDTLASIYSQILIYERLGRKVCKFSPISKMIKANLSILQKEGYIGEFKEIPNNKGGVLEINLLSNINKCGVIKPRYPVAKSEIDKFEKRFLPSRNMGILIISTSKGLVTHTEAKKKGTGGKLVAYCY
ncbi:30S ribosomal protein S8 [Candidatus Woesearchaeota archaeon]|nr:30S ribosomal protein S8 [Candidatus Woesearchaeota archaeon]